jgi:hypothetical protein
MLRYTENVHFEGLSRGIDLLELLAPPISRHLSNHRLSLISTHRKRVRHKQCQLRRANGNRTESLFDQERLCACILCHLRYVYIVKFSMPEIVFRCKYIRLWR